MKYLSIKKIEFIAFQDVILRYNVKLKEMLSNINMSLKANINNNLDIINLLISNQIDKLFLEINEEKVIYKYILAFFFIILNMKKYGMIDDQNKLSLF